MNEPLSTALAPEQIVGSPPNELAATRTAGDLWRDVLAFLGLSRAGSRLWGTYDLFAAAAAAYLGFRLSPSFFFHLGGDVDPLPVIALYAVLVLLSNIVMGVYEPQSLSGRVAILLRMGFIAALAWGILLCGYYVLAYQVIGRWIVATSWCLCVAAAAFPRMLLSSMLRDAGRRVLVVGEDDKTRLLARLVESAHNGCRIVGYVPAEDLSPDVDAGAHPPWPLAETCRRLGADVVVMADNLPPEADGLLGQAILCLQCGIQVTGVASFVEETFRKVPVELIGPEWLVRANLHLDRPYLLALKRGCDLAVAGLGLALTLPFWPLFALLVRLTSRGPAFYRQTRVGRFGRPFTICKFRTMRLDAESDGRARWAETNDPRVTTVGRIFRKTRVDELPQLWNILRGDMSFVGPRPERPE
ncbi:MAG: sugar transferase, partial [Planctomycetota bacterium]